MHACKIQIQIIIKTHHNAITSTKMFLYIDSYENRVILVIGRQVSGTGLVSSWIRPKSKFYLYWMHARVQESVKDVKLLQCDVFHIGFV